MLRDIDPDKALSFVLQTVPPARIGEIALDNALGSILAENIRSREDFPPFNRAMMDGYAVRLKIHASIRPCSDQTFR